ncbi:MAG: hypothetical protein QG608_1133 [Actinomycetota bacterium]|nr:hypothetical protein [Actinomycetota bacterium]
MHGSDRLEVLARDALRALRADPLCDLRLLNVSENATFAVHDPRDGRRTVLRIHRRGYHSHRAILSELAWVRQLRAEGIVDVPEILPAPDGSPVVLARHPDGSLRHAVRFSWIEGQEPSGDRLVTDFFELGAIAARLHRHSRQWRRPQGFTRLRWDWGTSVGPRGHWGRWQDGPGVGPPERAVLTRLSAVLRRRLAAFGDGPDRFGLIHADMRTANLLVRPDDRTVHVIDFDDCGFSWFPYDLAASLSFIEDDPRVPELVASWVAGYRTVCPLPDEHEAELPTFVLLRRLLLVAWIGSHAGTDPALGLGAAFTRGSCDLAEEYLTRFG